MEKKALPFLSRWGLGAGGGELWLVCKMEIKSFEIKKKRFQGEMVLKSQKGLFQDKTVAPVRQAEAVLCVANED